MSEKKSPGVFLRTNADGSVRSRRVGVTATLKAGDDVKNESATWNVALDFEPVAKDRLRDAHQTWWEVTTVGPAVDGVYPCTCTKLKE